MVDQQTRDWLLFASLLLNRNEPMPPHHIAAVRERLGHASDNELREALRTGQTPTATGQLTLWGRGIRVYPSI